MAASDARSAADRPTRPDGTATASAEPPRGRESVAQAFQEWQRSRAAVAVPPDRAIALLGSDLYRGPAWSALRRRLARDAKRPALNEPDYRIPARAPADALDWFRAKGFRVGFSYLDIYREEHARAFTVAKAMQQELLEDLRGAVDQALADGITFREFEKQLTPILQLRGWWGRQELTDPLTGDTREVQLGSPRRLRTIYDTNLRTARAAGQWQRIQRSKGTHPYLLYQLGPSREHREQHLGWAGLLLPVDDPWWDTHFPPNGWGCKCWVRQVSAAEAAQLRADGMPVQVAQEIDPTTGLPTGHIETRQLPVRTTAPKITTRRWTNRRTGQSADVPDGIDPGWDYNPGQFRAGPPAGPGGPTPAPGAAPAPAAGPAPAASAPALFEEQKTAKAASEFAVRANLARPPGHGQDNRRNH